MREIKNGKYRLTFDVDNRIIMARSVLTGDVVCVVDCENGVIDYEDSLDPKIKEYLNNKGWQDAYRAPTKHIGQFDAMDIVCAFDFTFIDAQRLVSI